MGVYKNCIEPFLFDGVFDTDPGHDFDLNPARGITLQADNVRSVTDQRSGFAASYNGSSIKINPVGGITSLVFSGASLNFGDILNFAEGRTTFLVGEVTSGTNATFYSKAAGGTSSRWGLLRTGSTPNYLSQFVRSANGASASGDTVSIPYSLGRSLFTQQITRQPGAAHVFRRDAQQAQATTNATVYTPTTHPFVVGTYSNDMNGNSVNDSYMLQGYIQRIISYNYLLTSEQIAEKEAKLRSIYNL